MDHLELKMKKQADKISAGKAILESLLCPYALLQRAVQNLRQERTDVKIR